MAAPFNANDPMDVDNAPPVDAEEDDLVEMYINFPDSPASGVSIEDAGADAASEDGTATAHDTVTDGDSGKGAEDTDEDDLAAPSYSCPTCRVGVYFPTQQILQAHVDYGLHFYPENDPAQGNVARLTSAYERRVEQLEEAYILLRMNMLNGQMPRLTVELFSLLRDQHSAEFYRRIMSILISPNARPADLLKVFQRLDAWIEQYCMIVLHRRRKCRSLAYHYIEALLLEGAVVICCSYQGVHKGIFIRYPKKSASCGNQRTRLQ
ncbi:hypothetical protein AURDEDRAFT_158040 [Auricularia subglabra TFB-10046 SS5]|nr:hypothetical protein AURDEDRAFT_158040 [Auricularia subglabra TFB-10046 SS5]